MYEYFGCNVVYMYTLFENATIYTYGIRVLYFNSQFFIIEWCVKVWPVALLGKYFDLHCIHAIIKDGILVR